MTKKKIAYENKPLPGGFSSADYEFRTPESEPYDPRWAVRIRRESAIYRTDHEITKSRVQIVSGQKFRIRSVFANAATRSLDDNIKYLIEKEIDNVS